MTAPTLVRFCGCGCGEPTAIAPKTDRRTGAVAGQPLRFVHGHSGSLGGRATGAAKRAADPAAAAPGAPRCGGCNYPMVAAGRPTPKGWRTHTGRDLCRSCYKTAHRVDELLDHPRRTLTHDDVLDDWYALHCRAIGRRAAAELLGIHPDTLARHIRSAQAAQDHRGVMGAP